MNMSRGIGKGTHIPGPVFNVATIGMTEKRRIELSTRYSDNDTEMVVARTEGELRLKLDEVLADKKIRVNQIGLELQEAKTKLLVIYSEIDGVWYGGIKLTPINDMKHLGVILQ